MEVKLQYGEDENGKLHHILEVVNGKRCQCFCPGCHAPLVAKNNGANVNPHFAHASGFACNYAHESELHLLAKEILAEEKSVMLPPYGNIFVGGLQSFAEMEVEERNDYNMLQPDVVGIQYNPITKKPSRLWIEIMVTHEVGPEKYEKIKALGVSCIEIDLSLFRESEISKETLRQYLLQSSEGRHWINNPVLQNKLENIREKRRQYAMQMASRPHQTSNTNTPSGQEKPLDDCSKCPFHTTRGAILHEIIEQKFPSTIREIIIKSPLSWFSSPIISPMPVNPSHHIVSVGNKTIYLPTTSPDSHGNYVSPSKIQQNQRVINFFYHTLPHLIQTNGLRCNHLAQYISQDNGNFHIICSHST